MQALSYGFLIILWTCFSAVAKAQNGCPGSLIPKDKHYELPANTKDIYAIGENLRLPCQTGYVGYVRIICTDGVWKITGKRKCDPKQCGHPGDTPYGDFILTRGDEFVFGSQVEYTCKKGYKLAGMVNHRSCLDQGWDNAIPICEVVKCRPIQQTGDLIASGNTENPQYGHIIQFECRTDNTKIAGQKQIHCTDTGEWSEDLPKCVEVTCTLPSITHGRVKNPKEIYKKHDTLLFDCDENHRPVERASSTCTQDDWRPKPQCEETVCKVIRSSRTSILPKNKIVFHPGETAEMVCEKPYRTPTKKQRDTLTCGSDGSWSFGIFCEEIFCGVQLEDNVAYWPWSAHSYRYNDKSTHHTCRTGFRKSRTSTCDVEGWVPPLCQAITCDAEVPNARILNKMTKYTIDDFLEYECKPTHTPEGRQRARCTEKGWEKKPECTARKVVCPKPDIDKGYYITDKRKSSVIYYGCIPGHKPSVEGWWGELTCKDNVFDTPKCIDKMKCVALEISNAKPKERQDVYSNGEFLTFECAAGYKMESNNQAQCVNGDWKKPLPICKSSGKMCIPPLRVEYAAITSKYQSMYTHLSEVHFQCAELYEMQGDSKVSCSNGTWSHLPICIRSKCSSPEHKVNNASAVLQHKKEEVYENGTEVDYQCEDTFNHEGGTKAICINGNWTYPRCIRRNYCEKPPLDDGKVLSSEDRFKEGEKLDYMCLHPYEPKTERDIICKNGQWDGLVECITRSDVSCKDPPIPENGDILVKDVKDGETVITYKCKRFYELEDDSKVKCHMGEWKPFPVCIHPCVLENMDAQYNIEEPREKYLAHGKKETLRCKYGYYINNWWYTAVDVLCDKGQIKMTKTCKDYRSFT
ncbi:hypothetical protein SKAU_G00067720 [Synaphobranchus kaupii]|uniref:Sushi domain-containing protein n=1 Tax=Synaphobranchus kaupii TaxID=118154 RepID=A0A9Q1G659_SYNKA|nr:hypothetical protein SKAU_G00067720 [Synaphobranchus kaupii]